MKRYELFATVLMLVGIHAHADLFPVATVLGAPDPEQGFVRRLVGKAVDLPIAGDYEIALSTEIYSLLGAEGVSTTLLVKAWPKSVGMSISDAVTALQSAALEATVVLWINRVESGGNDVLCRAMAGFPDVAFVFPAGTEGQGQAIDPEREPHCLADNILVVGVLDHRRQSLAPFSNFGVGVRLAAPGVNIPVVSTNGRQRSRTGIAPALAFATAQLAIHQDRAPGLLGKDLIASFLEKATAEVASLDGKVEGSRAIFPRHH